MDWPPFRRPGCLARAAGLCRGLEPQLTDAAMANPTTYPKPKTASTTCKPKLPSGISRNIPLCSHYIKGIYLGVASVCGYCSHHGRRWDGHGPSWGRLNHGRVKYPHLDLHGVACSTCWPIAGIGKQRSTLRSGRVRKSEELHERRQEQFAFCRASQIPPSMRNGGKPKCATLVQL